ncbi:hypothetical protein MMC25_004476 [Agyrium rufum]|nr:hypothetical protein [Agyrium rufum]
MALTVHHLQVSQSERIPWLCEELSIPYNLTLHQRSPYFSPQSIKDLNPLGQAPVIQDSSKNLTLAESGACVEYIIHTYGNGRLALPPSHPNYADYLYWFHFANSTFQPQILILLGLSRVEGADMSRPLERWDKSLQFLDERLKKNTYLAGEEFTAADVMIVTTLTTMRSFYPADLSAYEGILAYLKSVTGREGYLRARAKADPELEKMIERKPPVSYAERLKKAGKI